MAEKLSRRFYRFFPFLSPFLSAILHTFGRKNLSFSARDCYKFLLFSSTFLISYLGMRMIWFSTPLKSGEFIVHLTGRNYGIALLSLFVGPRRARPFSANSPAAAPAKGKELRVG